MGAQFFLPCRSRRAARRSAPTESILRDELVGGRISEAAVIPVGAQFCLPCRSRRAARRSAYRIHVVRWVGRAASNTSLQRHRKDGFDVIQQKLVLDRTGALVIEIESPGKEGNVVGTHFAPKCCTNSRHRTRATRCWQR